MWSRIKSTWLPVGTALLAVALLGGEPARAGGIVITLGTSSPVGDPLYDYTFYVELAAHSELQNGGYFTVYDLPGVVAGALTSQPSVYWGSATYLTGLTPTGTPAITDSSTVENVTWKYLGSAINNTGSSAVDLGSFVVQTAQLNSPPAPTTLLYVASLDGTTYTDQGTVIVNAAVPEPSSLVLLGSACMLAPIVIARFRRSR